MLAVCIVKMPRVILYRDKLIEHLHREIARLKMEIQKLIYEHQRIVDQLNEKIAQLEVDLVTKVFTDFVVYAQKL